MLTISVVQVKRQEQCNANSVLEKFPIVLSHKNILFFFKKTVLIGELVIFLAVHFEETFLVK